MLLLERNTQKKQFKNQQTYIFCKTDQQTTKTIKLHKTVLRLVLINQINIDLFVLSPQFIPKQTLKFGIKILLIDKE